MGLSVKFDGVELNQFIHVVSGFTPFTGANWDVSVSNDSTKRGADFNYTTYKTKMIIMPFDISSRLEENYNQLCKALNVDEPKELVFGSIPDKVFYAIPKGDLNFEQIAFLGKGTITWLIPDGLAHSTVEKTFPARLNADGILEATIVNEGTESVPISYDIVHNHENGYIGIVSEYGVMQYGRVEEADGENYKQNELLATGFAQYTDDHGVNHQAPANTTQGTLGMVSVAGGQWLWLGDGRAVGEGRWNGGMKTVILPADSEGHVGARNFYCYTRHWFEAGAMGQTGAQTITFLTADDRVICCMSISKGDTVGNTAHVDWAAGGRVLKSVAFTPADDAGNPYSQRLWRGDNDFRKEGETLTIYWNSIYYSFIVPEIKDMECAKIQLWIGQWGARNQSSQYMMRNYFKAVDFWKVNVEKWRDVPNRYPEGSTVSIDGESAKVYVNGMANAGDEMTGTKYFHAPPGGTKVEFYYSGFCDPAPTITARIREAYL